jgi:uncharacterized membrane protein
MRPEFYAVLTAICWAVGSYLEKKGVKAGNFTPAMGVTIRTFFSLIFLSILSYPYWGELKNPSSNLKPILYIIFGGGLIAGCLGITFLYSGLKEGNMAIILAIAFCLTPLLGAIIGYFFLKEDISKIQMFGIILCITGAAITVFNRHITH